MSLLLSPPLIFFSSASENCTQYWDPSDFNLTSCGRNILLNSSLPLLLIFGSFIYASYYWFVNKTFVSGNVKLKETQPLLSAPASGSEYYGSVSKDSSKDVKELGELLKKQHFDIHYLNFINEDGSVHGNDIVINRSFSEKLRLFFETFVLLFNFMIHLGLFFNASLRSEENNFSVTVRFILWTLLFGVGLLRLFNINNNWIWYHKYCPNLWMISSANYTAIFVPYMILARSIFKTTSENPSINHYYYSQFIIICVLFSLNWSASIGDKPVKLYKIKDLFPSPEDNVSIFSFVIYSWIDPLILQAYRSGIKMNDIWSLKSDDYAYRIIKDFEEFVTCSKFTLKIFKYFKGLFFLQGLLTVAESFLMFSPTFFLKKILEYVETPDVTPTSLAWYYLFLMFFLRLMNTVCFGVALFIGRRICIRMKAIIIGEIYSKGLRRKIAINSKPAEEESEEGENNKDTQKEEDSENGQKLRDIGGIINLMSVDAFKVSEICGYLHYFVSSALSATIAIIFLYQLLGWSALVGSLSIVLLLPINYKFSQHIGAYQKKILKITDKRIQKLNESLQSIRIIKFFTWENRFVEQIMGIREEELYALKVRLLITIGANFTSFLIPTFVTVLAFYCHIVIEGNVLTTPVAFTSISLFNLLRIPLDDLAYMLSFVIQSMVSLDRVNDFLNEPETTKYEQLSEDSSDSIAIGFKDASFAWDINSESDFKLRDLNVSFKEGELNVIIGKTGSGKTSLLLALLGEMEKIKGKVYLKGAAIPRNLQKIDSNTGLADSVAYCAQAAWLLNDSIKNNILFAAPFNKARYEAVVHACGLTRDFEILEYGDATEVGEKGITLSGGQKQRVSLARALYSNSKTVLLDDCLSAVDSHTALWIYENCITGDMMKNRTCILVSHNVALTAKRAKLVIVVDNGKITASGTPEELLKAGHFGDDKLIEASILNSEQNSAVDENMFNEVDAETMRTQLNLVKARRASQPASIAGGPLVGALSRDIENIDQNELTLEREVSKVSTVATAHENDEVPVHNLIKEEGKAEGVVSKEVYIFYAKRFGSVFVWLSLFAMFVGSQIISIGQSWWLRRWAHDSETGHLVSAPLIVSTANFITPNSLLSNLVNSQYLWQPVTVSVFGEKYYHSTEYYMAIFVLIGITFAVVCSIRDVVVFLRGLKASNSIFEDLLQKVFRAKLRFFDSTPIGRIMNRFSRDIESIDQQLAPMAQGAFISVIVTASTLILICSITPAFFLFAAFIMGMFYIIAVFYLTLSRELKRFESVSRSPIHQHFSETLIGVTTIRAFGDEHRFMRQNLTKIDENNTPFFYLWVANRWLHFRVDLAGSLVSFFAGAFVILSVQHLDAGLAGLSLSYAISFTESALWIVRLYSEVEMTMNSVERLQEYLDIEQEPPRLISETQPKETWPEKGEIEVKDLSLRYAPDLPLVIKDVTFDVESTAKIGIVGRTGAGKSTIITALFRFLDPETGFIKIDGIDITKIGLDTLRQAITIIPQDPTLFTGTIRSNLDPFDERTDDEIFEALRRTNLITMDEYNAIQTMAQSAVTFNEGFEENVNKFLDLTSAVEEGGKNLSQGQRQLMCLARSLLRNPKVILLDEATASIDYNSDAQIQATIRSEFKNSTILTIAHRLKSIIDYDKILVMDAGEVREYDEPWNLISNKNTIFYGMCANSGELETLEEEAKRAFEEKHGKK